MVLHTFFFAAIPLLFLYAYNIQEASFSDALFPLLVSVGVAAGLYFALKAILKNKEEAGLLVSLGLLVFYSYGHFLKVVQSFSFLDAVPTWLPLYAIVFVVGVYLVVRYRDHLSKPTIILNVIASALLAMSLFNIGVYGLKSGTPMPKLEKHKPDATAVADKSNLPDIYYIVFDSYCSERGLKEYYDYDNSALTDFLTEKGFYVTEPGRCNYVQTELSLASSLNMTYLDFFMKSQGANSKDTTLVDKLMRQPEAARFLKSQGYTYVLFSAGWSGWRGKTSADLTLTRSSMLNNEFLAELLETTLLCKFRVGGLTTRDSVLYQLSEIPRVAKRTKGPCFVFAHIIPPHSPFVFNREGGAAQKVDMTDREAVEKAYIEEVGFMAGKIEEMVDSLLSQKGKRPVIIIQADHGPAYANHVFTEKKYATRAGLDERTSILNAYYLPLPEGGTAKLHESITPVNSFRELFNLYFKTTYKILPDRSYYSTYERHFNFQDVTEDLEK